MIAYYGTYSSKRRAWRKLGQEPTPTPTPQPAPAPSPLVVASPPIIVPAQAPATTVIVEKQTFPVVPALIVAGALVAIGFLAGYGG